jgi:hypothetical protein
MTKVSPRTIVLTVIVIDVSSPTGPELGDTSETAGERRNGVPDATSQRVAD